MTFSASVHPKGKKARVLLSSVFGPYAQDDEFGSRKINPMELYQNQVTRVQGAFSLRLFHRSFGLMFIHKNIQAPCTLLDFPTLGRFIDECRDHDYDIVGISAIVPNIEKSGKCAKLSGCFCLMPPLLWEGISLPGRGLNPKSMPIMLCGEKASDVSGVSRPGSGGTDCPSLC